MKPELWQQIKLTMPVLGLGGGYTPAFGGNVTMPSVVYAMKISAQNIQGIIVPNSGNYTQCTSDGQSFYSQFN